jgi:hypothetical protein
MGAGSEIIGDLVEAAITARAVEPTHGEGAAGHTAEQACLNCGTALIGTHCHACGQAAHVHKTLGAFFHDLLHGVFHFEGKTWRTLPLLAWKPGKLTREYIDGRRASYVSPIALFLFSVFLMFAVIKQLGGPIDNVANINFDEKSSAAKQELIRNLENLRDERAVLVKGGQSTEEVDSDIKNQEQALKVLDRVVANPKDANGGKSTSGHVYSSVPQIQRGIDMFKSNPALALYKLQSNAYKFSWLLIPISVPFVWLLFPFSRRFGVYDHTVFVTYSLSFMTLMVVAATLSATVGLGLFAAIAVLSPPFHIYRQLKDTYALTRVAALWRTIALVFVAGMTLILFTALMLAETGA